MDQEKIYQVAMEFIPGIGDSNAKNLISYTGSASAVFKANKKQLSRIPGIGQKTIASILSQNVLSQAENIIEDCIKKEVNILHYSDKDYPQGLKQVYDAPNIIYTKGNLGLNLERQLAIVGTRNATTYGKEVTEKIIEEMVPLKTVIVSGLAYGIDIHAHRAALKYSLPTIAVLAGGLDKIYPSLHQKTAEEILENGALISENPPGVQAEAHFFPARNRIIAGMTDATIVVEAAKKGGALITANIADSYNKVVFAIPGNLNNAFSEGCNQLIRSQKANLYRGIEDLDYHLSWKKDNKAQHSKKAEQLIHFNTEEKKVYELLKGENNGLAIDTIAWKTQIAINNLASILLNLEFQGYVKSLPGKKYQAAH